MKGELGNSLWISGLLLDMSFRACRTAEDPPTPVLSGETKAELREQKRAEAVQGVRGLLWEDMALPPFTSLRT